MGERTRRREKDLQWIIGKRRETLVCPHEVIVSVYSVRKEIDDFLFFSAVDFLSLVESRCSFFPFGIIQIFCSES